MALTFETTHEYYFKNPHISYCEEHEGLVISNDWEDRVVFRGIDKETVLEFVEKQYKEHLEKKVTKEKVTK